MKNNNWDKTLLAIQDMDFFKCESGKVAKATQRTTKEARAALLNELFVKRLVDLDPLAVDKMIETNNYWLRTRITYSRKGLINQYLKRLKRETEADVDQLTDRHEQPSKYDIAQAIRLAPKIFPNKKTADIVVSTLTVGELETREKFNLSKRQYYRKIGDIERYCANHRANIRKLIPNTEQQQTLANRFKKLKTMAKLINQGDTTTVQQLIYSDLKFWESEIAEIPAVKYQYILVNDYAHSNDKKAFANYVTQQITKLESQIKEDK